jgi:hypothetical protein
MDCIVKKQVEVYVMVRGNSMKDCEDFLTEIANEAVALASQKARQKRYNVRLIDLPCSDVRPTR